MWQKSVRDGLLVACVALPMVLCSCSLGGQPTHPSPTIVGTPAAAAGTSGLPVAVASASIFSGPPTAALVGTPGQPSSLAAGRVQAVATTTAGGSATIMPRPPTASRIWVWGQPFSLSAGQARAVATVTAFIDAYNAGQFEVALALLAEPSGMSDCDYRAELAVDLQGKERIGAWIRERMADHDQLVVAQMANENPDQGGSGAHTVGVSYARRTSDTLRALGNPDGIVPKLAAKVILTDDDRQIIRFANGPYGGSPDDCRRTVGTPVPGQSATPGP